MAAVPDAQWRHESIGKDWVHYEAVTVKDQACDRSSARLGIAESSIEKLRIAFISFLPTGVMGRSQVVEGTRLRPDLPEHAGWSTVC